MDGKTLLVTNGTLIHKTVVALLCIGTISTSIQRH